MAISDQIDALQKRTAELKSSFEQSRHETNQEVKARLDKTKTENADRQNDLKEKASHAADRAQSQWQTMRADAAAKRAAMQDRMDRKRDEHDAKKAERDAEDSEDDAADALDYAAWAVDQAQLAVLDAVDARTWADACAAALPSS
jgi:chromosome segregation ATPase